MADVPEQIEELTPEEKFVKEKVDGLLEKVCEGHGEPMQQELADRLEKTVTEFHADAADMIESLKSKSDKRREKLKNLWEHRSDEQTAKPTSDPGEETPTDSSDWEKRIESKEDAAEKSPIKGAKSKEKTEEKPKKKKFGFFKRNKKKKE
jgi:hypothetical protein